MNKQHNKKAQIPEGTALILLVITVMALFAISFFIVSITQGKHDNAIKATVDQSNNNFFLLNLLRTQTEKGTLGQLLSESQAENDFTLFVEKTNSALKEAYGKEVAWEFSIDGRQYKGNAHARLGEPKEYKTTIPGLYSEAGIKNSEVKMTIWQ